MVGLFFADVVSAKDLREFILPDFDLIRIPQWAARVEYFKNDFHAEAMWIPVMSYDKIGKPGAEFFPIPHRRRPATASRSRMKCGPATMRRTERMADACRI